MTLANVKGTDIDMGKYFGTDGFRGEANKTLTVYHAFEVGRYLGWYYGKERECRIAIGKDTRRSSYMFESALAAGLSASGADAYLLHVTTTPSVSYIVRTEDFDCGIMISASHNPYFDNGIKLINRHGEKMSDTVTADVEAYLDGKIGELPLATDEKIGRIVDHFAGRNRYAGYIISLAKNSYRGIKVGLDASNGSTWCLAKNIFDTLGAETYVIGNTPNGININDSCGYTHIEALRSLVLEKKLDIGFAFDGDADRCLAVCENGDVLTGDHILYICAKRMKAEGKLSGNTVVSTVMSNLGLKRALDGVGIDTVATDVGDRFVYEAMKKGSYSLGGEESGHIIFSKFASTGDGLITAVKVMEAYVESGMEASRLAEGVVSFPQVTVNIPVYDKDTVIADAEVQAAKREAEDVLAGEGRVLLRKSGTEPVVRVMVEAAGETLCRNVAESIADAVRKKSRKL